MNTQRKYAKLLRLFMTLICAVSIFSVTMTSRAEDTTKRYIDQFVQNTQNPFMLINSSTEYISPFIGNLKINQADLVLKGKNGMDFSLVRDYNSAESGLFDISYEGIIEDNPNEVYYDIGSGWSFEIPYMKYIGYSARYDRGLWEVNYGSAGSDILINFGDRNSGTGTEFKNNKNQDKQVFWVTDSTEFVSGSHYAFIMLQFQNGTKWYFSVEGMLLGQVDRYGNTIRYEYDIVTLPREEGNGLSLDRERIRVKRVIDTLGRNINFQYNTDNVTVSVTDSGKTQQVRYNFAKVKDLTTMRPEDGLAGLIDYKDKVLSSVVDIDGNTTSYTYNFVNARKSYVLKAVESEPYIYMYALLSQVNSPGGNQAKYEYVKSTKNLGIGAIEFYKIARRYDQVILGDNSTRTENNQQYNYSFDMSNEYDGYPLYQFDFDTFNENLPQNFKIRVSVVDNIGTTEYIADKLLSVQEIIRTTSDNKTVEERRYDANNHPKQVIKKVYETGSTEDYIQTVTNTQLDEYGRLSASWSALTPVDGNYNPQSDEYKSIYTYDNRYGNLINKTYKQNATTTIQEKNILTSDGKSIERREIHVNGTLKEKTNFSYDSYGNVINSKIYQDGFANYVEQVYNYSGTGRNAYPTSVTAKNVHDADGNLVGDVTSQTEYDGFGHVTASTDAQGNSSAYVMDILGRNTKITYPDSTQVLTGYSILSNGFKVTQTNQLGDKFSIYYDSAQRVSKVVDEKTTDVVSRNTYDDNGRLKASYDVKGNRTEYTYHANGSVKDEKVINTSGTIIQHKKRNIDHVYKDYANNVYTKIEDTLIGASPDKNQLTYTYINQAGQTERTGFRYNDFDYYDHYTFDYLGNATEYYKPLRGNPTTFQPTWTKEYDYAGRVLKETNVDGEYKSFVYNTLGQPTLVKDYKANEAANNYGITYTYDELGRVLRERTPFEEKDGTIHYGESIYVYDKNGNLTEQRHNANALGATTAWVKKNFAYSNMNRLQYVKQTIGNQPAMYAQYVYNAIGNKVRMYTGLSSLLTINGLDDVSGADTDYAVTKYTYDHLSNLKNFTDPMGQSEAYQYDKNGNMTSRVDRNGTNFTYTYDGLNRVLTENGNGNNKTYERTNRYLINGSIDYVTTDAGTTSYQYDELGRVTSVTNGNYSKSYSQDIYGNRQSFDLVVNSNTILDADYTYDKFHRLNEVLQDGTIEAKYTYDINGNRESIRYGQKALGADYTYNLANRIKSIVNVNGVNSQPESALPTFTYTYQLDGNMIKEENSRRDVTLSYNYDDLNRLIGESKVNNGAIPAVGDNDTGDASILANYDINYTHDDYGNIKTKVENGVTTTYTYDKNCRVLTETKVESNKTTIKSFTYDPNGNQITEVTETYAQASGTNPTAKVILTGINNQVESMAKFNEYNLLNQLISVYNGGKTARYDYDQDGLRIKKVVNDTVTKYIWDGSNMVAELNNDESVIATYLYGTNLINKKDSQGNKHYYFFNAHGDVIALTDASGNVENRYEYNAYGEDFAFGNGVDNAMKYFGQYYDMETGSYYLRARYYNPDLMRFITEDSYRGQANDPLSLNLYTYVSNNPILYIDPSGHSEIRLEEILGPSEYDKLDTQGQYDYAREQFSSTDSIIAYYYWIYQATAKNAQLRLENARDLYATAVALDPYMTYEDGEIIFDLTLGYVIGESANGLYKSGKIIKGASEIAESNLTSLYRAVGPDEFYDIMNTGEFSVTPSGLQAKQFGLSFDETMQFAEKYSDIGAIVEVKVPTDMLNNIGDFTQVDRFIFKNGTLTIHADKLGEFNTIIEELMHVY